MSLYDNSNEIVSACFHVDMFLPIKAPIKFGAKDIRLGIFLVNHPLGGGSISQLIAHPSADPGVGAQTPGPSVQN